MIDLNALYMYCDACEARYVDSPTDQFKYSVKRILAMRVHNDEIIVCEDCIGPIALYSGGVNDKCLIPIPVTEQELADYVNTVRNDILKGVSEA